MALNDLKRAYAEDGAWFENHYFCEECAKRWTDEWSCMCDDDCPRCGSTTTPYKGEKITPWWVLDEEADA